MSRADVLESLTVGYSVLAGRAGGIAFPDDSRPEVLVCVQGGDPSVPHAPTGVRVVGVPGRGVARSRNAALDNATRRYLHFCDDDVVVNLDGVAAAVRHLQATGRALALGRGVDPTGAPRKRYPATATPLTLLNSGKAATYEMVVDVRQVRACGLRFDERFGAGAGLHLGDEYIFIADLLRAGLTGDAVPFVLGVHPYESSGSRWGTPADSHARAVALNRVFGRWAPAARLAFAARNRRRLGSRSAVVGFVRNGSRPGPVAAPVCSVDTEPART